MAPKGKAQPPKASTAPAPARLSLQRVALWVLTALLCLSVASKAQGYPLYGNSPLYGPGKLYARGLVPLSAVYEIGTLALLYVDRPIGVVALFAYIGGTPSAGRWPRVGAIVTCFPCAEGGRRLWLFAAQKALTVATLLLVPMARAYRPDHHSAMFLHSGGTAHALASADASPEASRTGSGTAMHLQLVLTVLATLLNVTNKGGVVSHVLHLRALAPMGFLKVGSGALVLGSVFSFAVSRHGIPAL